MRPLVRVIVGPYLFASAVLTSGCGNDAVDPPTRTTTESVSSGSSGKCNLTGGLDIGVCDPNKGPFSLTIDNPFFPEEVGRTLVLDGSENGAMVHLEITALDQTETIAGVTTRVVQERETHDNELVEISRNFFAQAPNGTVCYFGEDVDLFQGGVIVGHEGQWRAGGGNRPGIIMPPNPTVGLIYQQEDAPGLAEDRAKITQMGQTMSVPAGTFSDTIKTRECTPLESGSNESKAYAAGVGLIEDAHLELTSHTP
jgi:hypothetical protein